MGDIAVGARLAVGTLYNYFGSKSELLLAILRGETDELEAAGQTSVENPGGDASAAIAGLLESYLGVLDRHRRKLWRELFAAAISAPAEIGAATFQADVRLVGQLVALLETLQERGLIAPQVEAGRAAVTLYSIYFVWFTLLLVDDGLTIEGAGEEIRRGVTIVVCGLRPMGDRAAATTTVGQGERSCD